MKPRSDRGMAMVTVLGIAVLLTAIVALAITMSGRERRETGKLTHNLSLQAMTEATLQRARGFYAQQYSSWNTYLAYFVDQPVILTDTNGSITTSKVNSALTKLTTDHPELINPTTPTGYSCYMYARDNVDEFPPLANNPRQDNDLLIYIGAVCVQTASSGSGQTSPLVAELIAPLLFNPNQAQYANQASGGTQGLNNASQVAGYR